MVDVSSSWACHTEGQSLSDVLMSVNIKEDEDLNETHNQNHAVAPVLLSQPEESAPCLLSLDCRPCDTAIRRLVLVTQARTAEVYDQSGEYCGTVRGEREESEHNDSPDLEPFYRKQLVLDHPTTSCEIKLLSLGGRQCVQVLSIVVGLQTMRSSASVNPGIDMQQVQIMMEEMGTSLSPGAQHLMDMVHFQQQNQTSSLSSLFPLLMGGRALSLTQPQPPAPQFMSPASEVPPTQNGGVSHDSSPTSTDSTCSESSDAPVNPARLTEMMSQLMNGRGQALSSTPDLLPVLQSVCGHVTQLRLDNGEALKHVSNGSCELDPVMERRLEQMELRLKQHFDKRLDALEQKLESALSLALMSQGYSNKTPNKKTEETRNEAKINSD